MIKIKIPNKVIICGREWDIKEDNNSGGGCFDGSKSEITIGTKYPKDIPDIFVHEVIEAILTERLLRYKIPRDCQDNGDLIFVFNHNDFERICPDIVLALFYSGNK